MTTLSAVAADLLLLLHLGFILFVAFGAFLVLRWPRLALAHLPAVAWGAWIEFSGGICPLTPWEYALRSASLEEGAQPSVIAQFIEPLVYPPGLTREIQIALGAVVLLVNGVIYAWLLWRRAGRGGGARGRRPVLGRSDLTE